MNRLNREPTEQAKTNKTTKQSPAPKPTSNCSSNRKLVSEIYKEKKVAREMVKLAQAPAAKPDNVSSIFGTHMEEGDNKLPRVNL